MQKCIIDNYKTFSHEVDNENFESCNVFEVLGHCLNKTSDDVFNDFMKLKLEGCGDGLTNICQKRIAALEAEVEKNGKYNINIDETICKSFYFLKYIY